MDTRDNRVHNLLFLLSAAPIGLGCVIVSDDTDTEAATTSATNPTSTSGETEATTSATGTATEAVTSSATGDTTEGPGGTTEGPADTTDGTTGEPGSPGCESYANLVTECYMDEKAGAAALNYCIEQTDMYYAYGEECLGAFNEFLACLSALTCEELTGADPVCEAEGDALTAACV